MKHRLGMVLALGLAWLGLLALVGMGIQPTGASAQAGQATPVMMSTSNFMTPPPTVYPPTQVSGGQQVYYYNCMTCHGDRGQGLTQAWRDQIGAPDSNCWTAHCHASNRFESNFSFPKNVPAVVGPHVLSGFSTALNLHDFIQAQMPYQAPGSLTSAEYWELTAYLMQMNGIDLGQQPLDAGRAAQIHFTPGGSAETAQPAPAGAVGWIWLVGGLVVAVTGSAFLWRRARGNQTGVKH